MTPNCPYCSQPSKLATGRDIYPHRPDLYSKRFYLCRPCDAYVGCHPGTTHALGRLANSELRRAKMLAHAAFDPRWKFEQKRRGRKRSDAYAWLAEQLGIGKDECHIGMMDVDMCRKVVEVCHT